MFALFYACTFGSISLFFSYLPRIFGIPWEFTLFGDYEGCKMVFFGIFLLMIFCSQFFTHTKPLKYQTLKKILIGVGGFLFILGIRIWMGFDGLAEFTGVTPFYAGIGQSLLLLLSIGVLARTPKTLLIWAWRGMLV